MAKSSTRGGLLLLFLLAPAVAPFVGCADDTYPAGLDDADYDLEAMALEESDFPAGYLSQTEGEFDNEEFAVLFPTDDTDAKKRQLDALGQIRTYAVVFSWDQPVEHFGEPLTFTVQSTLYVDVESAQESIRTTCGLLMDDRVQLRDFFVPKIGDGGAGFSFSQSQEVIGESIELNVCFRTGRLVHAIAQSGLEGTQDVALSVRLAERMLERVELAFEARTEDGG